MNLTSGMRSNSCWACAVRGSGEEMVPVPIEEGAGTMPLGGSKVEGYIEESPLVGPEALLDE